MSYEHLTKDDVKKMKKVELVEMALDLLRENKELQNEVDDMAWSMTDIEDTCWELQKEIENLREEIHEWENDDYEN